MKKVLLLFGLCLFLQVTTFAGIVGKLESNGTITNYHTPAELTAAFSRFVYKESLQDFTVTDSYIFEYNGTYYWNVYTLYHFPNDINDYTGKISYIVDLNENNEFDSRIDGTTCSGTNCCPNTCAPVEGGCSECEPPASATDWECKTNTSSGGGTKDGWDKIGKILQWVLTIAPLLQIP